MNLHALNKQTTKAVCRSAGMDRGAAVPIQDDSLPVNTILKQSQNAIILPGEHGSIFSQLSSNPFFTAV